MSGQGGACVRKRRSAPARVKWPATDRRQGPAFGDIGRRAGIEQQEPGGRRLSEGKRIVVEMATQARPAQAEEPVKRVLASNGSDARLPLWRQRRGARALRTGQGGAQGKSSQGKLRRVPRRQAWLVGDHITRTPGNRGTTARTAAAAAAQARKIERFRRTLTKGMTVIPWVLPKGNWIKWSWRWPRARSSMTSGRLRKSGSSTARSKRPSRAAAGSSWRDQLIASPARLRQPPVSWIFSRAV